MSEKRKRSDGYPGPPNHLSSSAPKSVSASADLDPDHLPSKRLQTTRQLHSAPASPRSSHKLLMQFPATDTQRPAPLTEANLSCIPSSIDMHRTASITSRTQTDATKTSDRERINLQKVLRARGIFAPGDRGTALPAALQTLVAELQNVRSGPSTPRSRNLANASDTLRSCNTESTFRTSFKAAFFESSRPDVPLPGLPYEELIRYELDPLLEKNLIPNSSDQTAIPCPKPDICFGFSEAAFEFMHLQALATLPSDFVVYDQLDYWFPFLTTQLTLDGRIIDAQVQAASHGATPVNSLYHFHQRCGNPTLSYEETAVFSIVGDSRAVEIYIHWRHEESQTVTFQMNKINVGGLWNEDDVYRLRSTVHEIYEWTKSTRLSSIKTALLCSFSLTHPDSESQLTAPSVTVVSQSVTSSTSQRITKQAR
jgi:hypothetical protein